MGESRLAAPVRNTADINKPIWFHARKVNHRSSLLNKTVMERFREQKKDHHLVFINLEKAYDKIPRNVMWWSLDKHKVPSKYATLIKDIESSSLVLVN